jgi:hypothetical protein
VIFLNRYQWFVFVTVVVMGVLVSLGLQQLFMQVFLKPEKVAIAAAKRVGKEGAPLDYKKLGHLGTGLQRWVGTIEIILYSTSIVFGRPEFIAVWLGTKYVAAYRTWGKEPVGRTFYNRSLFGSGLNILLGAATGGLALWTIRDPSERFSALLRIARILSKGATMVQLIVGALIAIVITITVENLRRPELELSIERPPRDGTYQHAPAVNMRSLRVRLVNKPLPNWARWMVRAPALQCRGEITFHHLDKQDVFGRAMAGRWCSSPEPVPIQGVTSHGEQFQIFDLARLTAESRIDVYPGESELLDIAVRLDEDADCYGWNNDSYFCNPIWRNPNWKLQPGRYLVKVGIFSSGQKCTGTFRLINDVRRTDFRLENTA